MEIETINILIKIGFVLGILAIVLIHMFISYKEGYFDDKQGADDIF